GCLPKTGGALLSDRERAPVRAGGVSRTAAARRSGRRRRRPATEPAVSPDACDGHRGGIVAGGTPGRCCSKHARRGGTGARVPVAPDDARRGVPATASPVRTVRALLRPHRSVRGLRGTAPVFGSLFEWRVGCGAGLERTQ